MTDWWRDLSETRAEVWRQLVHGLGDTTAAARTPILATCGLAGFAEARVVVLRAADEARAQLEIHTDSATSKVSELAEAPGATLLIWDSRARLQIRLRCHITRAGEELTKAAWDHVPPGAQYVYGTDPAPGTPISADDAYRPGPDPTRFVVMTCDLAEIETLHLGPERHWRALFRRKDGWHGSWLAP